MSKHTQGPWKMDDGRIVVGVREDGKVQPVCAVFGIVEHGDMRDKECSNANAAMICAAPDLLAALQWVQGYAATDSVAMWDAVNAAIAKATGAA